MKMQAHAADEHAARPGTPTHLRSVQRRQRTRVTRLVLAATVLLLCGASTTVASAAVRWGVDSADPVTTSMLSQLDSTLGHPDFFGRYLGGPFAVQKSEVDLAFSQGVSILLIEDRPTINHQLVGSAAGTAAADAAAASAAALGAPAGTGIYVDIETGDTVDGGFIQGWYDEIRAKGYTPGYYGNPANGAFSGAYCSTSAATSTTAVWSSEFEPGRSTKATAPAFGPATPPCASDTNLWQYGIPSDDPPGSFCATHACPNVDTDLASDTAKLWSSGTMPPPSGPTSTSYTGPTTGSYYQSVTLTARLTDTATSAGLAGAPIVFTLGTQSCSGTTNGSGDASCSLTLTQAPGGYTVGASFAGDATHTASSDTKPFTITQAATVITVSATPPTSSRFGQQATFTAVVSAAGAPGAPAPAGSVTFFVDGVPVASSALMGGSASIATAALPAGAHTISATYSGDANFLPSTGSLPYAVTCDVTVSGLHQGALIVTASTCLTAGAHVNGAILVKPGGALDVEGATITGSIGASQGAGAVRICGSSIAGAVSATGASGLVLVGDPADGCAPNVIGGALDVQNNTHGVEAIDNTVGGAILTGGNSGPGPYPGETTTISGNHNPRTDAAGSGPGATGAPGVPSAPSGLPEPVTSQGGQPAPIPSPSGGAPRPPVLRSPAAARRPVTAVKPVGQAQKLASAIKACKRLKTAKKKA
ncbi:MAG: hypothetical protein QOE44_2261, partial [Solirubrobacteraceae bacterium]|nr:hypothetical protein [Solirubrobacteraceae bacterium]